MNRDKIGTQTCYVHQHNLVVPLSLPSLSPEDIEVVPGIHIPLCPSYPFSQGNSGVHT